MFLITRQAAVKTELPTLSIPLAVSQIVDGVPCITNYLWFSATNRQRGAQALELILCTRDMPELGWKTFLEAFFDVYNKDRAERAASVCHGKVYREVDLPAILDSMRPRMELSITPLEWEDSIPHYVLQKIRTVIPDVMPDKLVAVHPLIESRIEHGRDPLLCAQYGNWFVLLARWR